MLQIWNIKTDDFTILTQGGNAVDLNAPVENIVKVTPELQIAQRKFLGN